MADAPQSSKPPRICKLPRCGAEFQLKRKHQEFCCADHRLEYYWANHVTVPLAALKRLETLAGIKISDAAQPAVSGSEQPETAKT